MRLRPMLVLAIFSVLGPPLGYLANYVSGPVVRYILSVPSFEVPLVTAVSQYGLIGAIGIYGAGIPAAIVAALLYLLFVAVSRRYSFKRSPPYAAYGVFGLLSGVLGTSTLLLMVALLAHKAGVLAATSITIGMLLFVFQGAVAGTFCGLLSSYFQNRRNSRSSGVEFGA